MKTRTLRSATAAARRHRLIGAVSFIAMALAVSMGFTACGSDDGQETAAVERAIAVRVQQPERRTLENRMSYVGTVHAGHEVNVIARVQGTVSELPVAEGEDFHKGTVLARLDSPELEATVERLEAELEYWSRRHKTDKRLVERGAIPSEQADTSERSYRSTRATLAEAKAQLEKTVIHAPFDGTMLDLLVDPGEPLMPGHPLVLIGSPEREVRVEVIEEDLERGVDVGTEVELKPAGTRTVDSQVTKISSVSSGPARTFTVTVPLPEVDEPMPRKGGSIRAEFILERAVETVAVPVRAIGDRDANPHLFVISDQRAHRHEAVLGVTQDGWVAAEFGWDGESPVAITNVGSLRDGARVFPVSADGGNTRGGQ